MKALPVSPFGLLPVSGLAREADRNPAIAPFGKHLFL
jgi:hypothetical protein